MRLETPSPAAGLSPIVQLQADAPGGGRCREGWAPLQQLAPAPCCSSEGPFPLCLSSVQSLVPPLLNRSRGGGCLRSAAPAPAQPSTRALHASPKCARSGLCRGEPEASLLIVLLWEHPPPPCYWRGN